MKSIILLFLSCWMLQSNYEIIPVNKLYDDISDTKNQYVGYDTATMAKTYRGNSGMYYLIPAVGHYGIKAEQSVIDSIIKSGVIPIAEETPNPLLNERSRLLNIYGNIDYYVTELNNKLQMSLSVDADIDTSFYKDINKKVRSYEPNKAYQTFFVPLGVVIGEAVRRKVKGEWKLDKRYGYNPYFVPYISAGEDQYYLPWNKLADMLLGKKFDMKRYIEIVSKEQDFH